MNSFAADPGTVGLEIASGLLDEVRAEARGAEVKYGHFASSHEGLGVLLEEFDELSYAIRTNSADAVRAEAIQVAAVALRIAACCAWPEFRQRSGMSVERTDDVSSI